MWLDFFCNTRVVANKIKYIFFNLLFVPHELPYLQKIKYVKDTFLVFIKFLPKDIFIIGYFVLEVRYYYKTLKLPNKKLCDGLFKNVIKYDLRLIFISFYGLLICDMAKFMFLNLLILFVTFVTMFWMLP